MLASDRHAKPSAGRQMNFRAAIMAFPCGHLSTLEGLYLTSGGVVAQSAMSQLGLVSRVSPVHTAGSNCTGDEGGPFGFGDQVADPKPPQAAAVKSDSGERCGNGGTRSRQARLREASASKPLMTCRKAIRRCQNRGVAIPSGSAWGMPETAPAASGMEAARSSTRLLYGT